MLRRYMRGIQSLDAILQDTRLAGRMLIKYPALTLIGGFAMAIAIAIGALAFEVISESLQTSIPIEGGDRLVAIQLSSDTQGAERRVLRDFVEWREGLATVHHLSAFRTATHNLSAADGVLDTISVAEVTASTFAIAATPPLLGRTIQPQDEIVGAPPVIVIGFDAWQTRFAADRDIVGRTLSLGQVAHTVVGVMPEGFKFPVSHHYWLPLRFSAAQYERLQGPAVAVFGRLAPGATLEQANAELGAIGQRTVQAFPDLYARLRLIAMPYTREHIEIDRPEIVWLLRIVRLLMSGLLVVVAANLAILMYARTVTRLGEIAVRSALGASRRRLLTQLFIEAFALALIGAVAGLVIADVTLEAGIKPMLVASGAQLPFWITLDISPATMLYSIGLAALAALIVGVLPGVRATGLSSHANLRTTGGRSGKPLGAIWTSLIVVQVAISAAILPLAIYAVSEIARMELSRPGFAADQYLLVNVDSTQTPVLISRLEQEPAIRQVTVSRNVPGYEGSRVIRFADAGAAEGAAFEVNTLDVAVGLFGVYEATILAGRDFTAGDVGTTNVIVSRTFANELSSDAPILGRSFSFAAGPAHRGPGPTYQVVGVVDDFPKFPPIPGETGRRTLYHAASIATGPAVLTIRYRAAIGASAAGELVRIVADVDRAPLRSVTTLTEFYRGNRAPWRMMGLGLFLVTASVVLLSAAGIYALMSFTVAWRTREIGIRSALGANPRRLLAGIFGRVLAQVSIGLVIGLLLSGTLVWSTLDWQQAATVSAMVAAMIVLVGAAAAFAPARRGLRIDPSEALRSDG